MKRGNVFFSLESEISRIDVALEWKRVFHQIELFRLPTCDSFFLHLIFQMGGRLRIRYPDKCDRFRSRLAVELVEVIQGRDVQARENEFYFSRDRTKEGE